MKQKDVEDEVKEDEVKTHKVRGSEKGRKGEQESMEEVVGKIVDKRIGKMGEKIEENVVGILENFMARMQKGTVAKDKKVIEERYGTVLY